MNQTQDLEDKCNKLNRQVAQFRSQAKDLEIQLREAHLKYKKQIDQLRGQVKAETRRREEI